MLLLKKIHPRTKKRALSSTSFSTQLKVEPIRNSRLVKVHFDSNYPELSAKVPNTLATTYIQQNLESRFIATEQVKEWLTKQLEDLKAKVERADEALQAFGSKHDIISLDEKENVTMQRLTELNEALTKAESERMAKEALYKQTKDKHFDSLSLHSRKQVDDGFETGLHPARGTIYEALRDLQTRISGDGSSQESDAVHSKTHG